jgi:hypothetical protein
MRTGVAILLLGSGAIAAPVAVHGCASMPPDDCASRNRCAPPGDGAGDANDDQTMAEGGDAQQGVDGQDRGDSGGLDSGDASDSGDGSRDAGDGSTCDPTKSPHDDPCVVDDAYGVFVAAHAGSDATGDGSKAKPYATIGHALAALGAKRRLYLCDATYAEFVTLQTAASLYGGFACPGTDAGAPWSYLDGGFAKVSGVANQIPLSVTGLDSGIAVEDLWLVAANASGHDDAGNGLSSIAALVNASTVSFRRCTLSAGTGANGTDGTAGANYAGVTAAAGQANDGGIGGAGGSITCNDGTSSTGGSGGSALSTSGGDGGAQPMPTTSPGFDGVGATGGTTSCSSGAPGANGAPGDAGSAATTYGIVSPEGWVPSTGGNGRAGYPGQGGGGGGGKSLSLTGGTGGGAGGCGGAGGMGGGGGGGSIALACIGGTVVLEGCALTTSAGGNGGKGGDGQPGQGGGNPGTPSSVQGCAGGTGGNGAGASGGAGGTGGISVCIVCKGGAPTGSPVCTTADAGVPGVGGAGGEGGTSAFGSALGGAGGSTGLPGVAQPQLASP